MSSKITENMTQTTIKIDIPTTLLLALKIPKSDWSQYIYQTLAIELYREGKISLGKAKELAKLTNKWEMIQLLNQHNIPLNYSVEDIESDSQTLSAFYGTKENCF